ncbi:MAG: hypothetical protein ACRCXK_12110 [Wohlfahrtiimonas sp.]
MKNNNVNWLYFKLGVFFNVISGGIFGFLLIPKDELLLLKMSYSTQTMVVLLVIAGVSSILGIYFILKSNITKRKN